MSVTSKARREWSLRLDRPHLCSQLTSALQSGCRCALSVPDLRRLKLTLYCQAYVWLHRGAFTCAPELVKGHKTTK